MIFGSGYTVKQKKMAEINKVITIPSKVIWKDIQRSAKKAECTVGEYLVGLHKTCTGKQRTTREVWKGLKVVAGKPFMPYSKTQQLENSGKKKNKK